MKMILKNLTISLVLVSVLALGGCANGMLGAFGGALSSMGLTFAGDAVGQDIRETAVWRSHHNMLVQKITSTMVIRADAFAGTDPEKALAIYRQALKFSEDNQPRILVERLADRIRRAKERKITAQVVKPPPDVVP